MFLDPADQRGVLAGAAVEQARFAEVDVPVGVDVTVEGEDVAAGVGDLDLSPRRPGIVRLGDPRVAAGRSVERGIDVLAVIADRDDRLVVPRHVAVGLDHGRPGHPVVDGLGEPHVETDHEQGVDVARVRDDLDDRIELAGALARAQRPARAPGDAVVSADEERDERCRAVSRTRLVGAVAGRE